MEDLLKKAAELAGRPVEVEKTRDGQHIVLWFRYGFSPPPKEPTPEKALSSFIDMMLRLQEVEDNMAPSEPPTQGDNDGSTTGPSGELDTKNTGV